MQTAFDVWYDFVERPENDGQANDTAVSNSGGGDGAGETRWGWTFPTWKVWAYRAGRADISLTGFRAETRETLKPLAKTAFWDHFLCDRMPGPAAISVADFTFGSGGAVLVIQQHLRVLADGLIGPQTIAAIKALPNFAGACAVWRMTYYDQPHPGFPYGFRQEFPGLYRRASDCLKVANSFSMEPSA